MRREHWWAPVTSFWLLTLLGGQVADAQPGAGPGYYAPAGPQFAPPAGNTGSFPATMAPWPAISPYDNSFAQTYNEGGLWQAETNNSLRQHYFTMEALVSLFKNPEEHIVGSEGVPPMDGNVFPKFDLGGFRSGVVGSPVIDTLAVFQDREEHPRSPGMRLVWGYLDPDDSGLELSGFWSSDVNWLFRRGSDSDLDEAASTRITAGLPLDNGGEGSTVPYDELYRVTFDSEAFGAEATWLMTPKWDRKYVTLRPVWGVRYLFIRERFEFEGKDSGLNVTFLPDGTPDLESDPDPISNTDPYSAHLRSGVRSHLFGPQIGLRYGVGGDTIRIWGESIFGIMANFQRHELQGYGIGDPNPPVGADLLQDTSFSQSQEHTHVSPLLEQSVNLDLKLYGAIPLLRNLHILEHARARVGYSITGLWEMARPAGSIHWQGLPLYPFIEANRDKWYIQSWHFGIHWNY